MRYVSTISLSVALALLAGCATGAARPEPKRLLLAYDSPVAAGSAAMSASTSAAVRPRLVVRAVTLPDYLDRRELVRRVGEAEIARDTSAVWAERPAKAITRWVSLALAAERPDLSVESHTPADGRAPDAVLALTLDDLTPGPDGVVRLRGAWVYAPAGGKATAVGRFDADAPARDASAEASVAALESALGQAVKALATALTTLKPEGLKPARMP